MFNPSHLSASLCGRALWAAATVMAAGACVEDLADDPVGTAEPSPAVTERRAALATTVPSATNVAADDPVALTDPHPVAANELLGMVIVHTDYGTCSGMVIGADTVLTAQHCFCVDDHWLNGNVCGGPATVVFRPDPAIAGATTSDMRGVGVMKPGYNPSWIDDVIDEDLAIVKLDGVVPPHVKPFAVAQDYLPVHATTLLAGFGLAGPQCTQPFGTLFKDTSPLDGYEASYHPQEVLRFNSQVVCHGDSGGAVLDAAGDRIYGVHSLMRESDGPWTKSISTTQHHNWIKSKMCLSSPTNTCDGWGDPCNCSATNGVLWRQTTGATRLWQMQSGVVTTVATPGDRTADWKVAGTGDFNGDGNGDIAWRRDNGQFEIWRLTASGARITPNFTSSWPGTSWTVQGVGDFDGDGGDDVLWRDTSGLAAIWFHGFEIGAAFLGYNNTPAAVSNAWQIRGVADFNGDGKADILWGNASEQKFAVWLMNGGTRTGEITGIAPSATATIACVGDFEGDLRADILWRNGNGTLAIDFDGATATRRVPSYQNAGGAVTSSWSILAVADFDRDGRSDILWRDTSGQVVVWIMEGARFVVDRASWSVDSSWSVAGTVHAKN